MQHTNIHQFAAFNCEEKWRQIKIWSKLDRKMLHKIPQKKAYICTHKHTSPFTIPKAIDNAVCKDITLLLLTIKNMYYVKDSMHVLDHLSYKKKKKKKQVTSHAQDCDICIFFVRIRRLLLTWDMNDISMLR